jgi:hypothetical protein
MPEKKLIAKLMGTDGNVFAIVGLTSQYLKRAGRADLAHQLTHDLLHMGSYEEAIARCVRDLESAGYTVQ